MCKATIFIRIFGTQSLAKNFNVKARRERDNGSDQYAVALQMLRAKPIGILCSLDVRTTFLRVFHLHFFLNFSICRGYHMRMIVDLRSYMASLVLHPNKAYFALICFVILQYSTACSCVPSGIWPIIILHFCHLILLRKIL